MKKKTPLESLQNITIHILLIIIAITMLFPYLWMVINSVKVQEEIFTTIIPRHFDMSIYPSLFTSADLYMSRYIINSVIITTGAVFVNVITAALAAYVVARKRFPGSILVLLMMVGTLILPKQLLVIPVYFVVNSLHLLGTHLGIILVLSVQPLPFFVFFSFFKEVPQALEDAARIDGASDVAVFWKIVVPISLPAFNCSILISFLFIWSAFLFPFILSTNESTYTLPVILFSFMSITGVDWNQLFAMATITTMPIIMVFIFTQKKVFQGLISGSLKG